MVSLMYYGHTRLVRDERGASPLQYTLLVVLLAVVFLQLGRLVTSVPR
jgi:Flp pilus assembly pilin Flp